MSLFNRNLSNFNLFTFHILSFVLLLLPVSYMELQITLALGGFTAYHVERLVLVGSSKLNIIEPGLYLDG